MAKAGGDGNANYPLGLYEALHWAQRLQAADIHYRERLWREGRRHTAALPHRAHPADVARGEFQLGRARLFPLVLVDNFEWDRGWEHRFGLYELDPDTQVRTARPSAQMFSEIARTHTLTSDMVNRYAPEMKEQMFPG